MDSGPWHLGIRTSNVWRAIIEDGASPKSLKHHLFNRLPNNGPRVLIKACVETIRSRGLERLNGPQSIPNFHRRDGVVKGRQSFLRQDIGPSRKHPMVSDSISFLSTE